MASLRAQAAELPVDQLYDLVLEATGYEQALRDKGGDENLARLENIAELKTNILGYMKGDGRQPRSPASSTRSRSTPTWTATARTPTAP